MNHQIPMYLHRTHLYELSTKVSRIADQLFEFTHTIFHLQGGGQPSDKGYIMVGTSKYQILGGQITRETGQIHYMLSDEAKKKLNVGDEVTMRIDPQVRQGHALLHSSGHLIDLAVQRLKYQWAPTKAYHFEDGPYVEYRGVLVDADKCRQQINFQLQSILNKGLQPRTAIYNYEQAIAMKLIVGQFKYPYVRIVSFAENNSPCGGTHVDTTKEINYLQVTKVQKKGKNLKVSYLVK